ncbi:hypothetical protein JG30_12350 (plasmid) [Bombilactobacillus mellifer]|uniref:Superinfection exclusion protein B n=1 Tax=Bombilactobacillus mellifer TaxID=1218492 RepID=A0A0F4LQ94_9LACO|nr:super-infection exclusion protein B [Bombilactobacillus mellifer]KJY59741.1 hypothetical protein JG30_12350 [Bombilactobacillus mellifer]
MDSKKEFDVDSKNCFWASFFNFIVEPSNLLAVFLTSLSLFVFNFFPLSVQKKFRVFNFLKEYNGWVVVALLISLFLCVYRASSAAIKRNNSKKDLKFQNEIRKKIVHSDSCWKILLYIYEANGKSVELPYDQKSVRLLYEYNLISITSIKSFSNTKVINFLKRRYFFILSPLAEKYVKYRLSKDIYDSEGV